MTVEELHKKAKDSFAASVAHLKDGFKKLQVGRANPALVENIMVEAYGGTQPLKAVGNIALLDPATLTIQPWDKSLLTAIEKAIVKNLPGMNPMNNGASVMLKMPPLTEERRAEVAKQVKNLGEDAKISIRTSRQDILAEFKRMKDDKLISEDELFRAEKQVQTAVDDANKQVIDSVAAKEKDIMTL
jgi:ribosome recycling factor